MNRVSSGIFIVFLLTLLAIPACTPTPTPISSSGFAENTSAALTADAKMTLSAFETVVAQLTALSQYDEAESASPTDTPQPTDRPTDIPTQTSSPIPTNTPQPTDTAIPCNRAAFVQDISIPPGTIMHPGDPFTKTWRIKNIGTCTWTEDYEVVFTDGEQMGGRTPFRLVRSVAPGEITDITIQMISPSTEDVYAGIWQLKDASGQIIGEGTQYQTPLWVNITVSTRIAALDPDNPLDFAHNYCVAKWYSTAGYLGCPGPIADFISGSVVRNSSPVLEGGHADDEPAIVVVPSWGAEGVISGRFPPIEIHSGDHFKSLVGCIDGRTNCDVTFQLDYREPGGSNVNLGSWHEIYDSAYTNIDLDLSLLAGRLVEFTLTVKNEGDSDDDEVFWMVPRIDRP